MVKKVFLLCVILINIFISLFNYSVSTDEIKYISLEVRGEVKQELSLSLPLGSSFNDVLEYIELTDYADISNIPLNKIISNNEVIVIPKINNNIRISINTASLDELMSLPGIGEKIALRIIEYRENIGSFRDIDELKNIKGIGESKYNEIKEYISL